MDYTARYNELLGFFNAGTYTWVKFRKTIKSEAYPYFSDITDSDVKKGLVYYLFYEFDQATRDLYLTVPEQIAQRNWLFETGFKARKQQVYAVRKAFGMGINYDNTLIIPLTPLEVRQFHDEIKEMEDVYVNKSLPELYLWLLNGTYSALGYDFSNTGFNKKPFYSNERFYIAYDIFINGNYDNTIII